MLFEQVPPAAVAAAPLLTCKGKGMVATGYESSQGFVVKASSQTVSENVPSRRHPARRSRCDGPGTLVRSDGLRASRTFVRGK